MSPRSSLLRRALRLLVLTVIGVTAAVVIVVVLLRFEILPLTRPDLSGDIAAARSERTGRRVLFVGNSFTGTHSMPSVVREMTEADGRIDPVFVVQYTAGSWSWRRFARDDGLQALLEDVPWDDVVLQERSYFPALSERERAEQMDRHARSLASAIPWRKALRRRPDLQLWSRDGRHPSESGSYLAASVFYATLFGGPPPAVPLDGVDEDEAQLLREIAADVTGSRPPHGQGQPIP